MTTTHDLASTADLWCYDCEEYVSTEEEHESSHSRSLLREYWCYECEEHHEPLYDLS